MIKNFLSSSIFKNISILSSGTVLAQALPLLISPLLSRIFTPEDFGVFALFVAISTFISSFSTGRYELAIVLPKSDEVANSIFNLTSLISFFVAISTVCIFGVLSGFELVNGLASLGFWVFLIPVLVLVFVAQESLKYLNIRERQFKVVAISSIVKSISLSSVTLGVGFLIAGPAGLILGYTASFVIGNGSLIRKVRHKYKLFSFRSKSELVESAREYKDFPIFSMPGNVANSASYNGLKFAIEQIFGVVSLGFYSFAERLLGAPSSVLSTAVSQVVLKEGTQKRENPIELAKFFDRVLVGMVLVGIIVYSFIALFCFYLFDFVFGENWHLAGRYALLLLPVYLCRFVIGPVSMFNNILETQKFGFLWQGIKFITIVGVVLIALSQNGDFESWLLYFSAIMFVLHVIVIFVQRMIVRGWFRSIFQKKVDV